MVIFSETSRQALIAITIALNQFHLGLGDGWQSPTLKNLETEPRQMHFTIDDGSWIASATQIGKIVGCLIPVLCMDIVGRVPILSGCACIFVLVWLGIMVTNSVSIVCLMRLLFGVAYGANNTVDTLYLAEVSSASIRGSFSSLIMTAYTVGMLLEYTVATYLPYRATALVNSCIALVTLPSVLWMVEAPQFLLMGGRRAEAQKNFMRLKGISMINANACKEEFERVEKNAIFELSKKESLRRVLLSPANYTSTVIVMMVYALCDATGYAVIIGFASVILSPTASLTENQLTILLGLAQCVMCFLSVFLIDRCARRAHLLSTFSLISATLFCAAVLFYVNERVTRVEYFSWLIFGSIILYICVIGVAYPAVYAIRGELLPLSMKALGGCLIILANSVANTVESMSFLYVAESFGMYVNFFIYSGIALLMVVFVWVWVPETGKRPLVDIQNDLREREQG